MMFLACATFILTLHSPWWFTSSSMQHCIFIKGGKLQKVNCHTLKTKFSNFSFIWNSFLISLEENNDEGQAMEVEHRSFSKFYSSSSLCLLIIAGIEASLTAESSYKLSAVSSMTNISSYPYCGNGLLISWEDDYDKCTTPEVKDGSFEGKQMAQTHHMAIVLDNLDREVKKVIQHQTLPVLLFREVPHEFFQKDSSRKNLEEVHDSLTPDMFYLGSDQNLPEKEALLLVGYDISYCWSH